MMSPHQCQAAYRGLISLSDTSFSNDFTGSISLKANGKGGLSGSLSWVE
jgi:hypothetical protein